MTASDAARLAAQQSKRGKVTMPLDPRSDQSTAQRNVLEQIEKSLESKTRGPQMAGAAPGWPQKTGPQVQSYEQGRAPNRRRR